MHGCCFWSSSYNRCFLLMFWIPCTVCSGIWWVLVGSSEIYWVLVSLSAFQWVLMVKKRSGVFNGVQYWILQFFVTWAFLELEFGVCTITEETFLVLKWHYTFRTWKLSANMNSFLVEFEHWCGVINLYFYNYGNFLQYCLWFCLEVSSHQSNQFAAKRPEYACVFNYHSVLQITSFKRLGS